MLDAFITQHRWMLLSPNTLPDI